MKGTKNIGRTRERWTPHYEYSITTWHFRTNRLVFYSHARTDRGEF
jgi:hypothetical protein